MFTDKPWLKHYEAHVPEHLTYPTETMLELLARTVQNYPHKPAIIFKGHAIPYQELYELIQRLAGVLQGLGVEKGKRVAIHMPNCPQYVIAYYAALQIGAVVVPCNPLYQSHEMLHQLNDSAAEVLVTLSAYYPLIRRIRAETKLRRVIVAEIKQYFPPVLRTLFTLAMEKKKGHRTSIAGDAGAAWFRELVSRPGPPPRPVEVTQADTAVLMYTGGTTGVSKGAQLTHRNIVVNAFQAKTWLNSPDAVEVMLTQVPLFHSYGMTVAMNLSMMSGYTMVIVPDPRDLADVVKTIHKFRPTLYPGVPAMYNGINNFPEIGKFDLRSIKACISGAAGLPVEVQESFQRITGARLVEGYGLSEASPVTHANPVFGENRIGTIGLPWPDTEVKIVDVDTGTEELGVGEVGELCLRGPQIMKGYWNMPGETANALWPDPDGGLPWLHTGDIATMDEQGYFRIVDRKKDMILGAGGYNIYPREIEDVLYQHPSVLDAAAIGIPMGERGERIKVFVVLKPEMHATEQDIIEFCQKNLAPYKTPKVVEFRSELPKTIVGKILRRELMSEEKK